MDCIQFENGDATAETEGTVNTGKDDTNEGKEKHDAGTEVRVHKASLEPSVLSTIRKEIHYFAGHEISIWESLDSFGSVIWPAALALCQYLESNKATVDLVDKAVLEIGAGTGLVSIVASLLGAWVTATDLPEVLGNLRCNLSRNTRGHCRYTPQVAELSWGYELNKTFPHSVYRYDYILAADVVYHHDYLAELLATMRFFCQQGTTLIWANKTRFDSDLVFEENFKKTFNATLLADNGEVKIYSATRRVESRLVMSEETKGVAKKGVDEYETVNKKTKKEMNEGKIKQTEQKFVQQDQEYEKKDEQFREEQATGYVDVDNQEETLKLEDGNLNKIKDEEDNTILETEPEGSGDEDSDGCCEMDSKFVEQKSERNPENYKQEEYKRSWAPTIYYRPWKEVHNFLGQEITIQESIDSYGATIWPAALALCRFLETPQGRQHIDLLDKSVLELGAGTGLLSVVITLLGAKLTATDLPEILSNLRYNLNKNTRGRRRHEPLVAELYWGHKLDETFPRSTHQYDYVLATDVVYHHDFLAELLVTMRHFCQQGTTLVWANKVRYASDLDFINNFLRYFEITLLEELDDVKIYVATSKTPEQEGDHVQEMNKEEEDNDKLESSKQYAVEQNSTSETGNKCGRSGTSGV
uniref:Si:ch73-244f7.3 n=1 Tax=Cyprinus carpio TaxID=7962 RepID=A0A8C1YWC7_CYPCA